MGWPEVVPPTSRVTYTYAFGTSLGPCLGALGKGLDWGWQGKEAQIYLWSQPQKRHREFAGEKAGSFRHRALISALGTFTATLTSPRPCLWLAQPPDHHAAPVLLGRLNSPASFSFLFQAVKGVPTPSSLCPNSSCPCLSPQFPSSSWSITSELLNYVFFKSTCLCFLQCQTQVFCVSWLFQPLFVKVFCTWQGKLSNRECDLCSILFCVCAVFFLRNVINCILFSSK